MSQQLVWFRNDLRIKDNPALFHACQAGQSVTAIYIATPHQWKKHDDASVKIDFWRRNLSELQQSLTKLNINLHFFEVNSYQQIPDLIATICQQWQINQLYFNQEYQANEQQRDKAVMERCQKIGLPYQHYHDQLLIPPASLRTKAGTPYKVFTPFSKLARQHLLNSFHVHPTPNPCKKIAVEPLKQQCDLMDISWPTVSKSLRDFWPAGEQKAMAQLTSFCQQPIRSYDNNRNLPAIAGTSRLSPYLASGIISIHQCWQASEQFGEANADIHIWQNELLWREFYKHTLIDYPQVSKHKPWKIQTELIEWRRDDEQLSAWQQGKTGFPLIDAAMRQLLARGWMHNRLRMIVAMFLTKHLLIDWRLGERWFMQHLIDGDLAANNGGWQWCASTGTDAVPYFRIFNPVTQSQRFDPTGTFIRHYLPELAHLSDKDIHLPNVKNKPENYPAAIVDLKVCRLRALSVFKQLKQDVN
jgi:deoxyribodipyrimidine photo-lyase